MEENRNQTVETGNQQEQPAGTENQQEQTPSVDELLAQLAQERAEKEKNKAALDKALKEKGEITKQLRAKQTAEEQEAEAKREQAEQERLEREEDKKTIARYRARDTFRAMGMDGELLDKTVEAKLNGDEETVNSNITLFYDNRQADALKNAEAEWLKNRPTVVTGAGDEETSVTKEQFNRMGYAQRVEFKRKYPETYKTYTE